MAIKNTKLGGTDWETPTARIKPTDLNDTFNAAANYINLAEITFKNYAQMLFNADYIGFNSNIFGTGTPDFKKLYYATGLSSTYLVDGSSLYDFSGSTLDAQYWTTHIIGQNATVNQSNTIRAQAGNGPGISSGCAASFISNGSVGNYITGDSVFIVEYDWSYTNGPETLENGRVSVSITDGSEIIVVKSFIPQSIGADASGHEVARINIDKVNKTAKYTNNLFDNTANTTDLSSLGDGNWYLRFTAIGSNSTSEPMRSTGILVLSKLKKLSSSTIEYIIDLGTTPEDITDLIPIFNVKTPGSSTAYFEITTDGTNYEPVSDATIHRFTNRGDSLKIKVTLTDDGVNIPYLSEYAILYNLIQKDEEESP